MSVPQPADMTDLSLRTPWRRFRHVIVPVAAVLLAIGAFLLWGPIGVGNGPLNVEMYATVGWNETGSPSPAGIILPMYNRGGSAVVDAVDLVGGTRYATPRILALAVLTSANCGGPWPARAAASGFVMQGCGGRYRGPLIGRSIGPTRQRISPGFPAAAEAAAPRPGTCWVLTKIIIHYHVGIRHYAATDPFQVVVCAPGASSQEQDAASKAAEGLG
jgi:hypothetical protein